MSLFNIDRPKVLIVDDSETNRDILSEILGDEYDIIEAVNGAEAIAVLQKESVNISLVLLDIVMPVMDGYEVLSVMNDKHWINDVPVIMISSDNSISSMRRAYELGITEFISRPFDALIVRHRAVNTIMLYAKQKKLVGMVTDQMYEKEKDSHMMINILSHIVEFRNGESGMHVLHVRQYTEVLLRQLVQITDMYDISESHISLIGKASALHDIGKISVPDHILNKPGRFTPEEFEIMKSHSMAGATMLREIKAYQNEPLVKVAYEICRWHHERYDGKGYPDGLKGEEIPISAQVVALADVYDALTSERIYKKAFPHEKAIEMIVNGECGMFNPLLIQCLEKSQEAIYKASHDDDIDEVMDRDAVARNIMQYAELSSSEEILRLLDFERMKNKFFSGLSKDIHFEYTISPPMVTIDPNNSGFLYEKAVIMNPLENEKLKSIISPEDVSGFLERLGETSKESPDMEYRCKTVLDCEPHNMQIYCRSVWNSSGELTGVIGKAVDLGYIQ
ncbi:MAG: response regulator [Ruminococcus sp.]|nr:response regulator [Ruminococcus sp.]MDE7225296.1 response regulator [Ruminococcus sp.]